MLWIFTDIYSPALSGVPVTVDYMISTLSNVGMEVGLVSVGGPPSDEVAAHLSLKTWENLAFPGDQSALFSAINLARNLPRTNCDVFIIATPGRLGLTGLAIARLRGCPAILLHLADILQYRDYYPQWRPLVLIFPKLMFLFASYLVSRIRGSGKICSTNRASFRHRGKLILSHDLPVSLFRWVYTKADRVISLSKKSTDGLLEIGLHPDSIVEIPSGISIPTQWEEARRINRTRRTNRTLRLLYIGRVVPEKNLTLALDALQILVSRYNAPTRLDIVGQGHALADLQRQSDALGLTEYVKFWGPVPRQELAPHYQSADLFIFTSQTDTQGLVLSEAAWFGLPCLTVDSGSTYLSKCEGAIIVAQPRAEDIAETIVATLRHAEILGAASRIAQRIAQNTQGESSTAFVDLVRSLTVAGGMTSS